MCIWNLKKRVKVRFVRGGATVHVHTIRKKKKKSKYSFVRRGATLYMHAIKKVQVRFVRRGATCKKTVQAFRLGTTGARAHRQRLESGPKVARLQGLIRPSEAPACDKVRSQRRRWVWEDNVFFLKMFRGSGSGSFERRRHGNPILLPLFHRVNGQSREQTPTP